MKVNNSSDRTKESKVPAIVVSYNESENKGKKQVKFMTEPGLSDEKKMKKKIERTSSWSPDLALNKEKAKGKKKVLEKSNVKKLKSPPQKMELITKRRNSVPPEKGLAKANFKPKTKVVISGYLICKKVCSTQKKSPVLPVKDDKKIQERNNETSPPPTLTSPAVLKEDILEKLQGPTAPRGRRKSFESLDQPKR